MPDHYRNIGKIVSVFGLKGELILLHHLGKKVVSNELKMIFLEEKKDALIPYFIESAKKKTDEELCIKLEGIDTRESAARLLRKEAWLKEETLNKHASKNEPISWVGYHIIDGETDLGPVLEIIEQPHQVLCRLEISEKEILVPLHEETFTKADHRGKKLFVQLPDGLLDVYLG